MRTWVLAVLKLVGVRYPVAYFLQGGRFFLGTPPLVRGLPKIKWVLKLNDFLLFISNLEVFKCIKLLPKSSLIILNQNQLRQESIFSENFWLFANI